MGPLPTEEEHAAVMEEHAEAIRGRLRAASLSDVAVALHLASPVEGPTFPEATAADVALWGEQPRSWRYYIVKALGGLRHEPLSAAEQQAVLAAIVSRGARPGAALPANRQVRGAGAGEPGPTRAIGAPRAPRTRAR